MYQNLFAFCSLLLLACGGASSNSGNANAPEQGNNADETAAQTATQRAAEQREGNAPVTFQFAWPNTSAKLSFIESRTSDSGLDRVVKYSYHIDVRRNQEGHVIVESRDFVVEEVTGKFAGRADVHPLRGILGALRVDSDGKLLEVLGVEFLREAAAALADAKLKAGAAPLDAPHKDLRDAMMEEDSLRAAAGNALSELTYELSGGQLMDGEVLETETAAPIPLPGTPMAKFRQQQVMKHPVACGANGENGCAHFMLKGNVGDSVREAIETAMSKVLGKPAKLEHLEMANDSELVSDPRTMRPFSAVWSQKFLVKGSVADQQMDSSFANQWRVSVVWMEN